MNRSDGKSEVPEVNVQRIFFSAGGFMFKNAKVQALIFLAAGGMVGYGAANGFRPWNWSAEAAPSRPQASSNKQADTVPAQEPAECCAGCNPKAVLLARAKQRAANNK